MCLFARITHSTVGPERKIGTNEAKNRDETKIHEPRYGVRGIALAIQNVSPLCMCVRGFFFDGAIAANYYYYIFTSRKRATSDYNTINIITACDGMI